MCPLETLFDECPLKVEESVCTDKCDVGIEHLQAGKMETKTDSFYLIPDASSQDCYDIPRTFPSDRSSSLEGFHNQSVSIIDCDIF